MLYTCSNVYIYSLSSNTILLLELPFPLNAEAIIICSCRFACHDGWNSSGLSNPDSFGFLLLDSSLLLFLNAGFPLATRFWIRSSRACFTCLASLPYFFSHSLIHHESFVQYGTRDHLHSSLSLTRAILFLFTIVKLVKVLIHPIL